MNRVSKERDKRKIIDWPMQPIIVLLLSVDGDVDVDVEDDDEPEDDDDEVHARN